MDGLIKDDNFASFKEELFKFLSESSKAFLSLLPPMICESLLTKRDNHGLVHVAKIETEKLLIGILQKELDIDPQYNSLFESNSFYFGYEGRCAMPSNFDVTYCYALGTNAANMINERITGMMSVIGNVKGPVEDWIPGAIPITSMMHVEQRNLRDIPCIAKHLVDLNGTMFKTYEKLRKLLEINNYYRSPGPIEMIGTSYKDIPIYTPYLVETPEIKIDDKLGDYLQKEKIFGPKRVISDFSKKMMNVHVPFPSILECQMNLTVLTNSKKYLSSKVRRCLEKEFPNLMGINRQADIIKIERSNDFDSSKHSFNIKDLKGDINLGLVFCGRQSSGANNVIDGLLRFQKEASNSNVQLLGFLKGYLGLINNNFIYMKEETFSYYRNQGGIDYLGRYIEGSSEGNYEQILKTCQENKLTGIILCGSNDTMNNAVNLNEYLLKNGCDTKIICVPVSVSGSLIHPQIETSIGFDTAAKSYAELVGNLAIDAASSMKYWFFIRLMGKLSSQIVLEASLKIRPNIAIIAEEVFQKGMMLEEIVKLICDLVEKRHLYGINYGTVLLPECLLTFLNQYNSMINEINKFLINESFKCHHDFNETTQKMKKVLKPWSWALFESLPEFFQRQMLQDVDGRGLIHTSRLETERLLAYLCEIEIKERNKNKQNKISFSTVTHFFGYQGRSAFPTLFDCAYASACGFLSGLLVAKGFTSYIALIKNLSFPVDEWRAGAYPIVSLMHSEDVSISDAKSSIPVFGVDLKSNSFLRYKLTRKNWFFADPLLNPGPIQYFIFDKGQRSFTLILNHKSYQVLIKEVQDLCNEIKRNVVLAQNEDFLHAVIAGLESTNQIIGIIKDKY